MSLEIERNTTDMIEFRGLSLFRSPWVSATVERSLESGRYEAKEINIVSKTLTELDVVLELGASLGAMSTFISKSKGSIPYCCVEANPEMVELIKKNHLANNITNCSVIQGILSHNVCTNFVNFYVAENCWGSSLSEPPSYKKVVQVPVLDCNSIFAQVQPTYLICDIEHGEYDLFTHPLEMPSVNKICIELHGGAEKKNSKIEILTFLAKQGFILCTNIDFKKNVEAVYFERKSLFFSKINQKITNLIAVFDSKNLSVLDLRNKPALFYKTKIANSSYDFIIADFLLPDCDIDNDILFEEPYHKEFSIIAHALNPKGILCLVPPSPQEVPSYNLNCFPSLKKNFAIAHGLDVLLMDSIIDLTSITELHFYQKPDKSRMYNIAIGSNVTQSSLSPKWSFSSDEASRLVSGVRLAEYVMHTDTEYKPWIIVDLLHISSITTILVFNRPTNSNRADTLTVFVSNNGNDYTEIYSHRGKPTFGGQYNNKPLCVNCPPSTTARYVKVSLEVTGILHLDQIEVYGNKKNSMVAYILNSRLGDYALRLCNFFSISKNS